MRSACVRCVCNARLLYAEGMNGSDEDFYPTQNTFSGVEFPTIELNEILGNAVEEFDDKNESKKQAQDKDGKQTSFKRGVVGLNDGEVFARNNERIPLNTIARLVDFVFHFLCF